MPQSKQYVSEIKTTTHFNSHFSDVLKKNAATTYVHMIVLAQCLMKKMVLIEGGTIFDNTDGCAKQYQCATDLHVISAFCANKNICIHQAIGSPGYGK